MAALGVVAAMLVTFPGMASASAGSSYVTGRMTLAQAPAGLRAAVHQQAELTAGDGASGDAFGWTVSISGSTAVVGASGKVPNGAAYVFVRSGTVWSQQAELTASDGTPLDGF